MRAQINSGLQGAPLGCGLYFTQTVVGAHKLIANNFAILLETKVVLV